MRCPILGLDIGGANLKAAHSSGAVALRPIELWKQPAALPQELRSLASALPRAKHWAVTMSGELCDCFESSAEGVKTILGAVEASADGCTIHVWQKPGNFVSLDRARAEPYQTAAANWLAVASYGAWLAGTRNALLIDVGSTTTDIVPIVAGKAAPGTWSDPERLRSRELVYTGVERTPLCGLLGTDAAAEVFATTLDAYLALGLAPAFPAARTADGRPADRISAFRRLARMCCGDLHMISESEIMALARQVYESQKKLLCSAMDAVAGRFEEKPDLVITCGSGEFLIHAALASEVRWSAIPRISFAATYGEAVSSAACAFSVAAMLRRALPDDPQQRSNSADEFSTGSA